jgi:hypothetical protein
VGEDKNSYRHADDFEGKHLRKRQLKRPRSKSEDYIKTLISRSENGENARAKSTSV